MELSFEQIRKYWEHRHPEQRIPAREWVSVCCVLHGEKNPSCTLFLDGNSGFYCHACGAKGNLFQFEAKFSGCDLRQAELNVAEITGAKPSRSMGTQRVLVAIYDYRDAGGKLLFQKLRYSNKEFSYRHMTAKGWVTGLPPNDDPRPLFCVYDVVRASIVGLFEGEKDRNNANAANLFADAGLSATFAAYTSAHVTHWLDAYNPYFTGKIVYIFADNDKKGRDYSLAAATGIVKYAYRVHIVHFDELPEKGDVSDYLELYGTEKLRAKILATPEWKPPTEPQSRRENWLVDSVDWSSTASPEVDWLIEGVIQAGANGIIAAEPKTGKSLVALDLLLSMAMGQRWLGRAVKRRVRTAYISREDSPLLTKARVAGFLRGKGMTDAYGMIVDPSEWLWINTREQLSDFNIDSEEHLTCMAHDLKERGVEFAILDVFNRIHKRSENDNTEMAQVVERLSQMGREAGCSIGVVHHVSKENGNSGRFFTRIRGASAIHGWTEWSIGLTLENPNALNEGKKLIRRAEFESKAGESVPVSFTVEFAGGNLHLQLVDPMAYAPSRDGNPRYQQ